MSLLTGNIDRLIAFTGVLMSALALIPSIFSVAISIWVLVERRRKEKKEIAWYHHRLQPLSAIPTATASRADSSQEGEATDALFLVEGVVENTGGASIENQDIKQPLTFTFSRRVTITSAEIVRRRPQNLDAALTQTEEPSEIQLLVDLLQPGEQIHLNLVCAGMPEMPRVSARIEGMLEPPRVIDLQERQALISRIPTGRGCVVLVFALILLFVSLQAVLEPTSLKSGFILGLITALVIGWISQRLLYWWNRVLQLVGHDDLLVSEFYEPRSKT